METDWKDALSKLRDSGSLPEGVETAQTAEETEKPQTSPALAIHVEKKGRGGKTATIISGFTCQREELEDTARRLKQAIGTGGSARGGEILLQGEWKARAAEFLRKEGYKVKG